MSKRPRIRFKHEGILVNSRVGLVRSGEVKFGKVTERRGEQVIVLLDDESTWSGPRILTTKEYQA